MESVNFDAPSLSLSGPTVKLAVDNLSQHLPPDKSNLSNDHVGGAVLRRNPSHEGLLTLICRLLKVRRKFPPRTDRCDLASNSFGRTLPILYGWSKPSLCRN